MREGHAEMRGDYDELADRLAQLGATEEELEGFADQWDEMTPAERTDLRGMNDVRLRDEIARARQDGIIDTTTEDEEQELLTEEEQRQAELDADDHGWELLGETVNTIMDRVSGDPDLAARLVRLESSTAQPRTGLVKRLQLVAARSSAQAPEARQNDTQGA
jgi:hypothetical protein